MFVTFRTLYSIQSNLSKKDTLENNTKCPSWRDVSQRNEERPGPTLGVQISD